MKYFLLTGIFFILLIFNSGNLNAAYNIGNEGCKPEIIFDETGNNLHCSFYRHWGTKGVYYKKNIDGVWGGEMTLADSVGSPKHPSIAVRGNKVAIVYVADSGNDIRIRISTNAGLSFLPEETIDDGQSSPYKWQSLPDVTIDSSGYVHVVWSVRDDSNSFWRILYRYRTTSWQAVTTVDNYSMVLKKPSICVDPEDNIHIAYDRRSWSGAGYKYIGYRQKLSSGIWSAAETVWSEAGANDWNNLMAPDIGIISGYLHIVWQTGGANPDLVNSVSQILYSRKTNQTGSTWSSQVTIGTGYVPCLSGYKDRIKVIWYDANPNKQVKSRLSQNKGAVFESPVIVT
ncbi:MAG: hypothetical protein KKH98_07930, partial [Spirochaetes bacterium]|nr:hypothetical protein [Spirochaetota bacterium]